MFDTQHFSLTRHAWTSQQITADGFKRPCTSDSRFKSPPTLKVRTAVTENCLATAKARAQDFSLHSKQPINTRVGTLIVATIYLQLIQN